jgi:2'-5' RNA ligase
MLSRPDVVGLRWTRPDQWHVTLRFLGLLPDAEPVATALGRALVGVPPAVAQVGPAVGRFGRRVLHVPVVGLEPLAAIVVAATAEFGEAPEDRPFAGHLTLARAKGRGIDLRPHTGAAVAGEWSVEEVTLVESRLSPGGAGYAVVERFPLGA